MKSFGKRGQPTLMDMDRLDGDLLLSFTAVTNECFEQRGVGAGELRSRLFGHPTLEANR
jgi:hypothetical protein